ncbi:hypothetical protein KP509_1Z119200 [Ceratopteris richardii]|nr:hypothetical protein KP509_1Z119200 [Ceratopteris richardii]
MPSSLSPLFPPPVENIESILGHRAMVTQLRSPSPPFRHASESAYPQPNLHSTVHQDHYSTTYSRLSPSLEKHEASLSSPWERFLRSPASFDRAFDRLIRSPSPHGLPHQEVPSSDMQLHIRPLSNTFLPSPSNLFPLSPFPGCRSPNAISWLPPWPPSPLLSAALLSPSIFVSSPAGQGLFIHSPTGCSYPPKSEPSDKPC